MDHIDCTGENESCLIGTTLPKFKLKEQTRYRMSLVGFLEEQMRSMRSSRRMIRPVFTQDITSLGQHGFIARLVDRELRNRPSSMTCQGGLEAGRAEDG